MRRRSGGAVLARGAPERHGTSVRRARGSTRRRPVFAPGPGIRAARRTPSCLLAARSPPTARTPRASWVRRRAGIGARARGEHCADRHRVAARSRRSAVARRPSDQHRGGARRIPQRIRDHSESASRLAVRHSPASEVRVETRSELLSDSPALGLVRQSPEREDGDVARRHDVCAVPRPPHLYERWVLPCGGLRALDAGVDRKERSSWHAVLQSGPRRAAERAGTAWEALVKSADVPSEREDLRPSQAERARHLSQQR